MFLNSLTQYAKALSKKNRNTGFKQRALLTVQNTFYLFILFEYSTASARQNCPYLLSRWKRIVIRGFAQKLKRIMCEALRVMRE